jgi:hypothetical protein
MRERAQKISAELNFRSQPGSGTEIELAIPAKVLSSGVRKVPFWRRIHRGWRIPKDRKPWFYCAKQWHSELTRLLLNRLPVTGPFMAQPP